MSSSISREPSSPVRTSWNVCSHRLLSRSPVRIERVRLVLLADDDVLLPGHGSDGYRLEPRDGRFDMELDHPSAREVVTDEEVQIPRACDRVALQGFTPPKVNGAVVEDPGVAVAPVAPTSTLAIISAPRMQTLRLNPGRRPHRAILTSLRT
jgi:hypothetical protein